MPSQRVKIVEGGKLVIPAAFRREMGIAPGDTVVVELDAGELRVRSLSSAIRQVQARMRELNPEGRLLSDELIADRRAEAARE
ncbi:AbrB/MazE/SpoVT family DNA-binding domain-containing protein [Rubellimicrobium rubrum]|uniref:AbrB/MazE/SpoVT family DNA-binding domain-containing protein n=1 Tax=Rubellimicrobium rubrum TaxID=2585369 RepID=A0A5C4MV72_9RHOB|nr:AbrB/MazE/SpoVT family DNA-binding domain-containing protein [Rubellimicrobium rubrum]TNC47721.1 AbrB/MazE/SpoVT family DNA-binding domain-containing protein [Rubellimicrobium rubrum]